MRRALVASLPLSSIFDGRLGVAHSASGSCGYEHQSCSRRYHSRPLARPPGPDGGARAVTCSPAAWTAFRLEAVGVLEAWERPKAR